MADGGWTYCASENGDDGSSLYFCYLRTCPRCSVNKGMKPKVVSNKPASDTIGEICGDVTYEILSQIIKVNTPSTKLGKNRDRQADVDFVFYTANMLALGETKSSPLVIYPLEVRLDKHLTEVRDGQRVAKRTHTQATVNIDRTEIWMYIPHKNIRIHLGRATTSEWLYEPLIEYVKLPENVAGLIAAWKELYDVYSANLLRGQTDHLRKIKSAPSARYFLEMRAAFQQMYQYLKPGALAVIVSGKQSTFYQFSTREPLYVVQSAEILAESAEAAGFEVEALQDVQLQKSNKNARPRSLDDYYETLIYLQRK